MRSAPLASARSPLYPDSSLLATASSPVLILGFDRLPPPGADGEAIADPVGVAHGGLLSTSGLAAHARRWSARPSVESVAPHSDGAGAGARNRQTHSAGNAAAPGSRRYHTGLHESLGASLVPPASSPALANHGRRQIFTAKRYHTSPESTRLSLHGDPLFPRGRGGSPIPTPPSSRSPLHASCCMPHAACAQSTGLPHN